MPEVIVFVISAVVVIGGALGVILNRNAVRAALSMVASLFGIAVLFVAQQANFLAFMQVVVYTGAVVVLFLFVIMLLGVDRLEETSVEPLVGQRVAAVVVSALILGLVLGGLFLSGPGLDKGGAVALTGTAEATRPMVEDQPDVNQLGLDLFGRNIVAVEATALLLTIATVGALVLVRNRGGSDLVVDEPGQATR
ncbi:MAG: NADH-quinone oxidoreductase subunit J [Acidimicrobiales bacterium]